MELNDIITMDKNIHHGKPVFKGTLVPVHSLFCHLQEGQSVDAFVQLFPEVEKEQVLMLLKFTGQVFEKPENIPSPGSS